LEDGIVGILDEKFYDIGKEDPKELLLLKTTPSSTLGSCRYMLMDSEEDETDYLRILEIFKKYNIRFFLYNGGNDSMDTCDKISKYLQSKNYECRIIGVPKTIDNDLIGTDHCPGFGSAAKYIATTVMEVCLDARVYDVGMITVIEIMGRNAGWLAAASALASYKGHGPDLIYLPEIPFNLEKMMTDIERKYNRNKKVIICISEGLRTKEGKFIPELIGELSTDSFGHKQLGGSAQILAEYIKERMDCKVRGIELSLMQRCAAHIASKADVEEAFRAGQEAVRAAVSGESDVMIAFERPKSGPYKCIYKKIPLSHVANAEKKVPRDWINTKGNHINRPYIDYVLPLIQGEPDYVIEEGLPRFANLKKVRGDRR
jgi:6-phosphofructokinase